VKPRQQLAGRIGALRFPTALNTASNRLLLSTKSFLLQIRVSEKKSFQKEILRKLKFNQKRTNRTQICEDPKKILLVPFCTEDILREIEAALTK